MEGSC
jgi:hypothetical protein